MATKLPPHLTYLDEVHAELRGSRADLRFALEVLSHVPLSQVDGVSTAIAKIRDRLRSLATFNLGE